MSKKLLVSAFIGGFATIGALAWAAQSIVFVQPTSGTPIPWPLDGSNIPKVDCVTGCGGGGAGTVTEIDTSGGVTGGPITTTGTLTLTNLAATSHQWLDSVVTGSLHKSQPAFTDISGTAAVTQGGTGATTLGANGVVLGEGSAAVHVTGAGTAGDVLTSNGAGVDPTFQAAGGGLPIGGVTGQVLNAVTSSPAVWGSVVIGPDAVGGSGGNGADITIQSGAADGAGTDGVIRLNAACENSCSGIVIGDANHIIFNSSIAGDSGVSGSNNGGLALSLSGGNGDGTGGGGDLTLRGGAASDAVPGNIAILSGHSFLGDHGGGLIQIISSAGNGMASGGDIVISSGNSGNGATGDGGQLNFSTGSANSTDGNGGAISVTAGNGSGTGDSGTVSFSSGAGFDGGNITIQGGSANGSNGNGAAITIIGGSASGANGGGGSVILMSGAESTNGITGNILIETANESSTNGATGNIEITTGNAGDPTAVVGPIQIVTGSGGAAMSGGSANIHIVAGDSQGDNNLAGGNILIQSGAGLGGTNSSGGDIAITVGIISGTGAASGDVRIENSQGGSGSAHLQFQAKVPTVTTGAGDCGTSATVAGNDVVGEVTVGSGLNGGQCTVTFSQTWHNKPSNVDITPNCISQNETHLALTRVSSVSAIAFVITGTLLAGDVLNYHCLGQE